MYGFLILLVRPSIGHGPRPNCYGLQYKAKAQPGLPTFSITTWISMDIWQSQKTQILEPSPKHLFQLSLTCPRQHIFITVQYITLQFAHINVGWANIVCTVCTCVGMHVPSYVQNVNVRWTCVAGSLGRGQVWRDVIVTLANVCTHTLVKFKNGTIIEVTWIVHL